MGAKNNKGEERVMDGRERRSERTRKKIMEAMLALVEEGNLVPTAPEVSERAGVGLRTVFRHFDDKEGLSIEMDQFLGNTYSKLFDGGDRSGSLPERIKHAAQVHDRAFDKARN